MPYLDSSDISSVWYDGARRTLRATFRRDGKTFVYEGVSPDEYDDLMAGSVRALTLERFNAQIRDSHPFHEF